MTDEPEGEVEPANEISSEVVVETPAEQATVTEEAATEDVKTDEDGDGGATLSESNTRTGETNTSDTKTGDTKTGETKAGETKTGNTDGDTVTSKNGYKPGNKFSPNAGAKSGPKHAKPDNHSSTASTGNADSGTSGTSGEGSDSAAA
ncbi:hypothetical protein [Mycobacterium sp. E136]|uniref:hypothetical protein n=1 Tax=Mycobacterium sp. E136 TaxID=1834125 RepID=UPI0012E7DDEC|nr:hypothetical protein [Mycobacterium sp. E136]